LFGFKAIVVLILLKYGWTLLDKEQDLRLSYFLENILTELRKNPEPLLKEFLPLDNLQARSFLNTRKNKKSLQAT
jgi:hypothetical protein